MAFAKAGLQNVAVGPKKLYIYNTADTLTSTTVKTDFNTTNCPGMAVGDMVMLANTTSTTFLLFMITAIDATSSTYAAPSSFT